MALVFELTTKKAVFDIKEFCKLKKELTYIGRFASKETSEVIPGTIIQYDGKFYSSEIPGVSGISNAPADEEGMVTSSLQLFKTTEYVPNNCKSVDDCPIRIRVWDTNLDDEAPIAEYAFYGSQLDEAKKVVNGKKDVDIYFNGDEINKEDFLNLE